MKKILVILLLFFFSSEGFSQKFLQKEWDASEIEEIIINGDAVFAISVTTETTEKIVLRTLLSGETFENSLVTASEAKGTLTIGTAFTPFFEADNDKLAAHKVLSIEMELSIPENKSVSIYSEMASLETKGMFKLLTVSLENGSCILYKFSGNAQIQTKHGDITVFAGKVTSATAVSKYGVVLNELIDNGSIKINAESLDGNISLFQTK